MCAVTTNSLVTPDRHKPSLHIRSLANSTYTWAANSLSINYEKFHVSRKEHKKLLILARGSTLTTKMSSNIKIHKLLEFRANFTECTGSHCAILRSNGTKEKSHKRSTINMLQI